MLATDLPGRPAWETCLGAGAVTPYNCEKSCIAEKNVGTRRANVDSYENSATPHTSVLAEQIESGI